MNKLILHSRLYSNMSPVVLHLVCFVSHVFGIHRLSTFTYKGNVAYYNRLPALKEIVVSSNIVMHCVLECLKMHPQCRAIEICAQKDENLCRLYNYTCQTFTKDGKDVCRHLQLDHTMTDGTESCLNDWEPVFFAKSRNGEMTYDAWIRPHTTIGCVTTNGCLPSDVCLAAESLTGKHLTSPLISNWTAIGVQQVKVELYKNGTRVAYFLFNGEGSDKMNWFSASRLIDSSYVDIGPQSTFNVFSIDGNQKRRFNINHKYAFCRGDIGWMYISDAFSDCSYEIHSVYPQILYGKNSQKTRWDNGEFGRADSMTIHILRDQCNE